MSPWRWSRIQPSGNVTPNAPPQLAEKPPSNSRKRASYWLPPACGLTFRMCWRLLGSSVSRIVNPALELWLPMKSRRVTRTCTSKSPSTALPTKLNWSRLAQMSFPPAVTVNVSPSHVKTSLGGDGEPMSRSEEHTSELQSQSNLV